MHLWQDLRYAVRLLVKDRWFTLVAAVARLRRLARLGKDLLRPLPDGKSAAERQRGRAAPRTLRRRGGVGEPLQADWRKAAPRAGIHPGRRPVRRAPAGGHRLRHVADALR